MMMMATVEFDRIQPDIFLQSRALIFSEKRHTISRSYLSHIIVLHALHPILYHILHIAAPPT